MPVQKYEIMRRVKWKIHIVFLIIMFNEFFHFCLSGWCFSAILFSINFHIVHHAAHTYITLLAMFRNGTVWICHERQLHANAFTCYSFVFILLVFILLEKSIYSIVDIFVAVKYFLLFSSKDFPCANRNEGIKVLKMILFSISALLLLVYANTSYNNRTCSVEYISISY